MHRLWPWLAIGAVVIAGLGWWLATSSDERMATVPAGRAVMGSTLHHTDESPARMVYLDAFSIDVHEVTNADYRRFVLATGAAPPEHWGDTSIPEGREDHPVVGVSWEQASDYCTWAGGRLPTEAEWERACRGSDELQYPWGREWQPGLANIGVLKMPDRDDAWPLVTGQEAGPVSLRPVGTSPGDVSPYGVYDLAGNAMEWVADWYDPAAYLTLPAENPIGAGPPWDRSVRGGAWLIPFDRLDLAADQSRCSFRSRSHVIADPRIGFRCAWSG